jgi:hypothetical protein
MYPGVGEEPEGREGIMFPGIGWPKPSITENYII